MDKRLLYLDVNIINFLRVEKYPNLNKALDDIDKEFMSVVFSPAHLEEIAVSEKRYNLEKCKIQEEIDYLTKIAGNNALRGITEDELVLFNEYPDDCYKRVIDGYILNDLVEGIEQDFIRNCNINPWGDPKLLNNIDPKDFLNNFLYKESIIKDLFIKGLISKSELRGALKWSFTDLKDRFIVFQSYVNLAANLLEKLGYYREKENKSRSRLHDVSHIIYAAYCDVFVSHDKKLLKKQKLYTVCLVFLQRSCH